MVSRRSLLGGLTAALAQGASPRTPLRMSAAENGFTRLSDTAPRALDRMSMLFCTPHPSSFRLFTMVAYAVWAAIIDVSPCAGYSKLHMYMA